MSESNIDFMIQPQMQFTQDENGLEYIEINNPLATAKIALQGGHVLTLVSLNHKPSQYCGYHQMRAMLKVVRYAAVFLFVGLGLVRTSNR